MRRPGLAARGGADDDSDGDDAGDSGFARAPAGGGEGEGLDGSGRVAFSSHRALVLTPSRPQGARKGEPDGRALRDRGWYR
jgi:hypothetical protein